MAEQIVEEWEELNADYKQLEVDNKAYLQRLEEVNNIQKICLNHIAHQRYRIASISKSLKDLRKKKVDDKKLEDVRSNIMKRKAQLYEIEQTLPKPNGTYLKIILGNVNVSILNKEGKFKYKDEYEKFKLILSMIGILMAILNFFVRFRPLELSYIFLLVWYYCTLTIRESILKVNGSRIRGWWRLHHFLSTVAAGILLIWPDNDSWSYFRNQFMLFNIYINNVMYPKSNIPPLHTMPTLLLLLLLSSLCQLASTDKDPSSTSPLPPPAPQPVFQPPEQPPAAPFPLRRPPSYPYVDGYGYDVYYPHQKPVAVPVYQETPSGGYMSSLIPATQSALQFTLRALAKFGLFLVGGAALLLVGGIFTTALCSLTPICVISFPGLTGIDKESVRSMMTPDRISAAAAMVQDAIGKYQRLQRAVGKR